MKSSSSHKSKKTLKESAVSSVRQKKEILKEVLTVMKFTIGLNYKEEEKEEVPFCCRIYFHDEEKQEAKLLISDIPLLNVISNQTAGFEAIES